MPIGSSRVQDVPDSKPPPADGIAAPAPFEESSLPVTLEQQDSHSLLRLEGDLTVTSAAELRNALLESLALGKNLQLDLESAGAIDVTLIQLLWAAGRSAARAGLGFAVHGTSALEGSFPPGGLRSPASPASSGRNMAKVILTVDDSASVRQVVRYTLAEAGYSVIEAIDGQDALAKLQVPVNLVITDLNMPNLDGIGLIRRVRANPVYKGVPILMLTTESQESRKLEGKSAGATGWIVKPFNTQQLLAVVKRVLG